jgi:hypothetical protein
MMNLTFYDYKGNPICYTDDYTVIYLFSGEPVAHVIKNSLYSFSGKHLGRFENGWVRDNDGECVFFTRYAIGGPSRPTMKSAPTKHSRKSLPWVMTAEWPPFHPIDKISWSKLSGVQFFWNN